MIDRFTAAQLQSLSVWVAMTLRGMKGAPRWQPYPIRLAAVLSRQSEAVLAVWRLLRCLQVFMYYKASADDNEYAHPMDLCPVVDLNEGRVIHIDAYPNPPPIPMTPANYHRQLMEKPWREPPKPLHVVQPQVGREHVPAAGRLHVGRPRLAGTVHIVMLMSCGAAS